MAGRKRTPEILDYELKLAALRSHELHMRHIYGLRWGGLGLATLAVIIGALMLFRGLSGSFNWAVEVPNSVGARLTNASPGIVFATVGLIIGFVVVRQRPVSYGTNYQGQAVAADDELNDPEAGDVNAAAAADGRSSTKTHGLGVSNTAEGQIRVLEARLDGLIRAPRK